MAEITPEMINTIYPQCLQVLDRSGAACIYVTDTDPPHMWLTTTPYTTIPTSISSLWAGERGDAVAEPLMRAVDGWNERHATPTTPATHTTPQDTNTSTTKDMR